VKFTVEWSMPNRWTFQMPCVGAFVARHMHGLGIIVDPFAGQSGFATHRNDIAISKRDSREWLDELIGQGLQADGVLFDPPYSPRQIAECYKAVGRQVTGSDTQNAVLYAEIRTRLNTLLKPGGVALSFGWQSSGFGKKYQTEEIMLVRHGGAHNDTICVAQRKPLEASLFTETEAA
jgi:hypothetical protein